MINHAPPTPSSAAASNHGAASPSLELLEARRARNGLATLLRAEQFAMADFLIALADFDQQRGWEALGYSSLFAFLHVDLMLPNPSAYWRKSAAQALHRFPDLIEPLRDGRLCCSSTAELAKVLTDENKDTVLPRFFGLSSREAQEVVAEIQPRQAPATRTVVTRVNCVPVARATFLDQPHPESQRQSQSALDLAPAPAPAPMPAAALAPMPAASPEFGPRPGMATATATPFEFQSLIRAPNPEQHPNVVPLSQLRTPEVDFGGGARTVATPDEIEPLSAERRRVHVNVGKEFVRKLNTARSGLSHAIPGATLEQVLEAGLDLLLERQAKARGQVKRPRTVVAIPAATESQATLPTPVTGPNPDPATHPSTPQPTTPSTIATPSTTPKAMATEPPSHRRDGHREAIPAAVRRAVWVRDQGRCSWPLDGGGCCGSTHRLELDHVVPWAEWGGETEVNLRLTCAAHNRLAARRVFGERVMGRYLRGGARSAG